MPRELVPVHHGKSDVEQRDIRSERRRRVKGAGSIMRDDDLVPFHPEHLRKEPGRVLVVVDDENAKHLGKIMRRLLLRKPRERVVDVGGRTDYPRLELKASATACIPGGRSRRRARAIA